MLFVCISSLFLSLYVVLITAQLHRRKNYNEFSKTPLQSMKTQGITDLTDLNEEA